MGTRQIRELRGTRRTNRISRRTFLRGAAHAAGGVAATAGVVGAGTLTAGCGLNRDGALGDGTGEITVWTWPDNDRMFLQTIPSFERRYPRIRVRVQGFSGTFNSKLLGALVSGTGPDVAMVEITNVSNFKSKPGFVDLSRKPFGAAAMAGKYADFSWKYVADDRSGRIFALPKNTGPGGMFYRRDLFKTAGLPTEPADVHAAMRDWPTFVSAGRKLAVKGQRWLLDDPGQLVAVLRNQAGVSYFDASGTPQLDSDIVANALEFAVGLQKDGLLAPDMSSQERGAAINEGAIATFFSGNWFGGLLKAQYAPKSAGKWGVALAPATDGVSAFNYGGDFIGVLQASTNQLAAWEFVKWVTQDPVSLAAMYGRDLYPAWKPAWKSDWINKPDPYYANENVNTVFSEVSATMRPPVTNPNDALASTALSNAVTDVVHGVRTVRAALRKAQADLEDKVS
ncbi:extracellular solute-binding protein [Actinopolymorpha rutila]|uniref:ABC-type glycerol-3-phosphate transport system substrate-binding protein n=1 Tax=Actinopolymorpha rutila TaxID=446787 RepID=A0A852Z938_9ACTN|nr:extracellular solute-binding protein [Actinopolymorpha rutila]NYH88853.1 ABC-type glycerol-3-phosphate transport system substrate-binding protein [Actinopolymorpha rutila]